MFRLSIPVRSLPSPPGVAQRIIALCRQETIELQPLSDAIMADPALSARVLRFAYSPERSPDAPVASVRDAVLLMGVRATQLAALGFTLPRDIQEFCPHFDLQSFWSESQLRAAVARHVVAPQLGAQREIAFTAALLAHIGQLVFAQALPREYSALLKNADSRDQLRQLESKKFGADHVVVGTQVLEEWGLSGLLSRAVRLAESPDSRQLDPLAQSVRFSQRLIDAAMGAGAAGAERIEAVLDELGLAKKDWEESVAQIDADYRATTGLYAQTLIGAASATQLLTEARKEMLRINAVGQLRSIEFSTAAASR